MQGSMNLTIPKPSMPGLVPAGSTSADEGTNVIDVANYIGMFAGPNAVRPAC
jgi:hypothetical protein